MTPAEGQIVWLSDRFVVVDMVRDGWVWLRVFDLEDEPGLLSAVKTTLQNWADSIASAEVVSVGGA